MKKLLILIFLITLIIGLTSLYFYLQNQTKNREAEQTKTLLAEINENISLMDAVKDEMPKELLDVHEYLMSGALGNKIYKIDPKFAGTVMYHDAKTQSIFINTDIELPKELWIPVFYHEVAHIYWHTKHPAETEDQFQSQLFDSENYAYTVNAEAWDLVMKHYPVKETDLKNQLSKQLFKNYSQESDLYNAMVSGDQTAVLYWNKIIEAGIKQQKLLSGE